MSLKLRKTMLDPPLDIYYVKDIIREGNHTIWVLYFPFANQTGEYWFSNDNPNYIVLKMFLPASKSEYPTGERFQYFYYTRVSHY